MILSADHHFQIGHSHYTGGKICQDYALSSAGSSAACAIVSDGCSTGGYTDVGARIVSFLTLEAIRAHAKSCPGSTQGAMEAISARQAATFSELRPSLDILGVKSRDMYATCAYAYVANDGGVVHVRGDGVVAMKYLDGSLRMTRFDWDDNTPFYPWYEYDGVDLESFVRRHGGDLDAPRYGSESILRPSAPEGAQAESVMVRYALRDGISGITIPISAEELLRLRFIAVLTDGITQIAGMGWQDAVVEFLAFKTTAGEFVKRRVNWGIKDSKRFGVGPVDDIALAAIHIDHEGGREEAP
ncbi:MAG: protein phosphatase 2C domain-containing protein [bacterium]|nr:protein phosphatase 2C domain-containing protein [bacterium]